MFCVYTLQTFCFDFLVVIIFNAYKNNQQDKL